MSLWDSFLSAAAAAAVKVFLSQQFAITLDGRYTLHARRDGKLP